MSINTKSIDQLVAQKANVNSSNLLSPMDTGRSRRAIFPPSAGPYKTGVRIAKKKKRGEEKKVD